MPQSDLFLTLAQTETGVSCFLARGWLESGGRNRLQIQRLKDKCGNRSNASSEVEFRDLEAVMIGDEGRGIRTIIEMAHLTRLDCAVGSSGLMSQALSQAIHHTTHRSAFQRRLAVESFGCGGLEHRRMENGSANDKNAGSAGGPTFIPKGSSRCHAPL